MSKFAHLSLLRKLNIVTREEVTGRPYWRLFEQVYITHDHIQKILSHSGWSNDCNFMLKVGILQLADSLLTLSYG